MSEIIKGNSKEYDRKLYGIKEIRHFGNHIKQENCYVGVSFPTINFDEDDIKELASDIMGMYQNSNVTIKTSYNGDIFDVVARKNVKEENKNRITRLFRRFKEYEQKATCKIIPEEDKVEIIVPCSKNGIVNENDLAFVDTIIRGTSIGNYSGIEMTTRNRAVSAKMVGKKLKEITPLAGMF